MDTKQSNKLDMYIAVRDVCDKDVNLPF